MVEIVLAKELLKRMEKYESSTFLQPCSGSVSKALESGQSSIKKRFMI